MALARWLYEKLPLSYSKSKFLLIDSIAYSFVVHFQAAILSASSKFFSAKPVLILTSWNGFACTSFNAELECEKILTGDIWML